MDSGSGKRLRTCNEPSEADLQEYLQSEGCLPR